MEKVNKEQLSKVEPKNNQSPQALVWVIIGVGSLVAIVGAIYLGLGTGKRLAPVISGKLPKPTYVALPMTTSRPAPSEEPLATSPTEIPTIFGEPTSPPDPTDDGVYVLDFSNSMAVILDDLANLTPWELKVARNEIYARHGRKFIHQDLSCYFAKQSWYQIDSTYTDSKLSKLETTNATFILNYEKEIMSPLINKDSGCDQDNP